MSNTTAVQLLDFTSFIFADGEELKTTSLKIAEAFGKQHKNVLRDIDNILTQVSDIFGKLNFELSEYTLQNNLGLVDKKPMYNLTFAIKEAYINGFNFMRAKLFPKQPKQHTLTDYIKEPRQTLPAVLNEKITAQQKIIMMMLASKADKNGKCQMSLTELAPLCGIEKSTTSKNLTALIEAGFLTATKSYGAKGGSLPNTYVIPERFRVVEGELLEPVALPYLPHLPPEGMTLIAVDELETLKKNSGFDEEAFSKFFAKHMTEELLAEKGRVDISKIKNDLLAVQSKTESVLNYLDEVKRPLIKQS